MKNISPLSNYYFHRNGVSFTFYIIAESSIFNYMFILSTLRLFLSLLQNKPVLPGPPAPQLLQSNLISLVPPVLWTQFRGCCPTPVESRVAR